MRQAITRNPRAPVLKAWKVVDLQHADAVARGVLKIGTLSGFAALENGRADTAEGSLRVLLEARKYEGTPEDRAKLERVGFVFRNGASPKGIEIGEGVTFEETPTPTWAFCMTEVGCEHDPYPAVKKAIFEIADVEQLGVAIGMQYRQIMSGHQFGRVAYRNLTVDHETAMRERGSVFVKDPKFRDEREIRLAFFPRRDDFVKTLFTEAKAQIASLLTRVR